LNDLLFVVVDAACKQFVLNRAGRNSVEIQISSHISADNTVVAFEELADFDLVELRTRMRSENTFVSVTAVVVNHYLTIITGGCNDALVGFGVLRIGTGDHFEIKEVYRLLVL
jgi:hypothetical protein